MWAMYAIIAWLSIGFVRCFAAAFYYWGKKAQISYSWKKEVASDLIAAVILAVLIIAWLKGL